MHIHTIQLNIEKLIGGTIGMDATEFGAYMSLIVSCYQSQNNLPNDDKRLARMARVSPKVWKRIKPILEPKFTKSDLRWSHDVVQKELDKYSLLSTKNRANALKKNKTDEPLGSVSLSQNEANTNNNKQITNNNNNKPPIVPQRGSVIKPDDVDDDVWSDFINHRKRKKANITKTALGRIKSQADKAGMTLNDVLAEMVMRGWVGFKAEWVEKERNTHGKQKSKSEQADDVVRELYAEYGIEG